MKLFEIYAKDHGELLNFLNYSSNNETKLDELLSNYSYSVINWLDEHCSIDTYNEENDTEYSTFDELHSDDLRGFINNLPSKEESRLISDCVHEVTSSEDNEEAPSSFFFDPLEIIPRNTWLIHFSNDAKQIHKQGFKHGMYDLNKLGLTTKFHNEDEFKKNGGWNFAFIANSSDTKKSIDHDVSKYGYSAVMFQSSGVAVYHHGDQENQVIFQGKYINPRDTVYIEGTRQLLSITWQVMSRDEKILYENDDIRKVINWVEQNYQQYKNKF